MRASPTALSLNPTISRLLAHWRHGYLLESLVVREIRVRYRRSALGVFWTLLSPLLTMVVFTIVFSTLFARSIQAFPIYFLSAHLTWHFFSQTSTQAMSSMLRSAALYKRIYVPKYIFVLATVGASLINYLLAFIPLAALVVFLRHPVTPAYLFLPVSLLILVTFVTGVSFIVATIAVFFDDITQFYSVIMQATMYLTAIFYPLDIVPANFRILIKLNPMYHLVQMIRIPIYYGTLPPAETLVMSVSAALGAIALGSYLFNRLSDRFVYYV